MLPKVKLTREHQRYADTLGGIKMMIYFHVQSQYGKTIQCNLSRSSISYFKAIVSGRQPAKIINRNRRNGLAPKRTQRSPRRERVETFVFGMAIPLIIVVTAKNGSSELMPFMIEDQGL